MGILSKIPIDEYLNNYSSVMNRTLHEVTNLHAKTDLRLKFHYYITLLLANFTLFLEKIMTLIV